MIISIMDFLILLFDRFFFCPNLLIQRSYFFKKRVLDVFSHVLKNKVIYVVD